MARERRAWIGSGIWNEESIRDLTPLEQQAYFLTLTQPDLNRCGVLPYRPKRWAKLAKGLTERHLRDRLRQLHGSRHVVLDDDCEELLVRTYIVNDGLLTQPLVVAAMVRDFYTIVSPAIRTAVLAELRRIWTIKGDAERAGIRLALGAVHDTEKVRKAFTSNLAQPMADAITRGTVQPFEGPLAEPFDKALVKGLPLTLSQTPTRAARAVPGPGPGPEELNPPAGTGTHQTPRPATSRRDEHDEDNPHPNGLTCDHGWRITAHGDPCPTCLHVEAQRIQAAHA